MVGWHTGLRVSDACNLKWGENVNLQTEEITVVAKKTRRYNKKLIIPIEPELLEMFKQLRASPDFQPKDPYCVPSMAWRPMFDRRSADIHFRKVLNRAGIPKEYSFHSYRHSFVTRMVCSGVNPMIIASLTGQSLAVIQTYSKVSSEAKKNALSQSRAAMKPQLQTI
jgi:integrase